jgi:hypothetical protein
MTVINWQVYRIWKAGATSFDKLDQIQRFFLKKWLVDNMNCLLDDFLIVHTDFQEVSNQFHLLGVDRAGNQIVVALDFSGIPETSLLYGLKLAGHYALMTADSIVTIFGDYLKGNGSNDNAVEVIKKFLGTELYADKLKFENSQRIIVMAEKFDRSYEALAFYLLNCGVTIDSYKATPYIKNENLSLRIEQLIIDKDSIVNNVQEI